jgi:hypothetical protein
MLYLVIAKICLDNSVSVCVVPQEAAINLKGKLNYITFTKYGN